MKWAVRIIRNNNLQVVGFQEMQTPQLTRFRELTAGEYGIYPGNKLTTAAMANSITWQKSQWRLVQAETVQIPYFHGNLIRMPYVLLQNRVTGREAWFFNSHNPANAHGDAQRWRNKAVAIESALFNRARRPTTRPRRSSAPATRTTATATSAPWSRPRRCAPRTAAAS